MQLRASWLYNMTFISRILLVLVATSPLLAQSVVKPKSAVHGSRRYVDALVALPNLGPVYYDDGAADGTIMVPTGRQVPVARHLPAVKAIVDLGDASLPVLIDCLNDTRITSATMTFKGGDPDAKPVPVPVGEVCLDILLNVVVPTQEVFVDSCPLEEKQGDAPCCFRDGLGACVNKGFYFRPDSYDLRDGRAVARPIVSLVQSNWQQAYKGGRLRYQYPEMWKRQ